MDLRGVAALVDPAARVPSAPVEIAVAESIDDPLRDRSGRREAVRIQALDAVPFDRIVTRGHVDAAVASEMSDHDAYRGRRRDAQARHLASHARQSGHRRGGECGAGCPPVVAHDQARRSSIDRFPQHRPEGGREPGGRVGGHRGADDSSGAGDRQHEWCGGGVGRHWWVLRDVVSRTEASILAMRPRLSIADRRVVLVDCGDV